MNSTENNNPIIPGYYNMSGPFLLNPQLIHGSIENVSAILLMLKNQNLENLNDFLPLPNKLIDLDCSENKITELPDLPNSIEYLNCNSNSLDKLPSKLPKNLIYLFCRSNKINELPELPEDLTSLDCMNNNIKQLPKLPEDLEFLNCIKNELEILPRLPENLQELYCGYNKLEYLPELGEYLTTLSCYNNSLAILPELPKNLMKLDCTKNKLTSMPDLPESLRILFCRGNNFDDNSIEKIINFYEKAIKNKFHDTNPSFQEELDYFTTYKSITVEYSLKNQNVPISKEITNEILEFSNLRKPKYNGGKKNRKKTKKLYK